MLTMAKARTMTPEHKEALAIGRRQGKIVKDYLEAIKANKPKRGRKRTPDSINQRLKAIEVELSGAEPIQELLLIQEQSDLTKELEKLSAGTNLDDLENRFVEVAAAYSQTKGIEAATWRKLGVESKVLTRAGIR
ncbi:MAG: hypothetical protein R2698_05295 [Microthrixaceae bacterium]